MQWIAPGLSKWNLCGRLRHWAERDLSGGSGKARQRRPCGSGRRRASYFIYGNYSSRGLDWPCDRFHDTRGLPEEVALGGARQTLSDAGVTPGPCSLRGTSGCGQSPRSWGCSMAIASASRCPTLGPGRLRENVVSPAIHRQGCCLYPQQMRQSVWWRLRISKRPIYPQIGFLPVQFIELHRWKSRGSSTAPWVLVTSYPLLNPIGNQPGLRLEKITVWPPQGF